MRTAQRKSRWRLAAAAVVIGIAVVAIDSLTFSLLTGRPLSFSSDVEPVNVVIVAIPYLILAALSIRQILPWLVGLAMTLSLWGYSLYGGVTYQWNPDGRGADIGMGIIMLFSPSFITGTVLGVYFLQKRASQPRN